jgi:hypothetical protein
MTDYARHMIQGGPDRNRRLVYRNENISVGIKTWGEIIEENRARLQFFQDNLQHIADESVALRYLQERHKRFLDGVIEETTVAVDAEDAMVDVAFEQAEGGGARSG